MATLDGRELDLSRPGAVLSLTTEAKRDWVETLQDGASVQVHRGSITAILRGLSPLSSLDDVQRDARRQVNEALDLMAVRSLGAYSLTDATAPTINWALPGGTTVLRTTSDLHSTFSLSVGGPPSPPPSLWHPSMRYFRISQTTTDLSDAFRNLYLAIESLLSAIEPMRLKANGGPDEGEGRWVERAILAAERRLLQHNNGLVLGRYLDPPNLDTGVAAVAAVKADLYEAARTKVFHAKVGRPVAVPQHDPDRAAVADALARYARFFTDLAEAVLGARFLVSGLAQGGFDGIVEGVLPRWTVIAAQEAWTTEEEFAAAPPASFLCMPTTRAPEYDAPFQAALRGKLEAVDIPEGFTVVSIGSQMDNLPGSVDALGATLTLEGVDVWEHILTFRAYSQGLKAEYSS